MSRSRLALAALLTVTLALLATACGPAPAPFKDADNGTAHDHGWFEGGKLWRGDLNDPHVVRVGGTYYAYGSPIGGRYLPVLTSTDMVNWYVHPRWSSAGPPGQPGYSANQDANIPIEIRQSADSDWGKYDNNDALVAPAAWGLYDSQGPWLKRDLWAPGVMQIGNTWYAYSAVRVSWTSDDPHGYGRFCLTVAAGPTPLGPFRDISGGAPIQCQPYDHDPAGSIDPYPFHDPATGKNYLLWKAAGKQWVRESALMSVELGGDGKPLPGAPWVDLLETNRYASWEGGTIENPAMVMVGNVYYLFDSANDSVAYNDNGDSNYATGYAICTRGPSGGCYRPAPNSPLLASNYDRKGPGGASAFLDTGGNLQLAYAYYWAGENRSEFSNMWQRHPRRMAVTRLSRNPDNTLRLG